MPITTLDAKFAYELGSIYDSEHHFLQAQEEMLQQATDSTLRLMLETHIAETQQQIQNLEQVFQELGQAPQRVACHASASLVEDARRMLAEVGGNPQIMDTVMIGAQAKVEHFEIACYRGLLMGAQMMGLPEVTRLLQQNLQQEEQTAQHVEQSAQTLLQQAMQAQSVGG